MEEAGAFAVVLELMTEELSALITEEITIPTIGIGASSRCDGQVLVFHDMLQYGPAFPKKFVKSYANLNEQISSGISQYVQEVKSRSFPSREHVFFKGMRNCLTIYTELLQKSKKGEYKTMEVIGNIRQLREKLAERRRAEANIGLIPTMATSIKGMPACSSGQEKRMIQLC